jgi:signal transduction histidine kinase/CheY-like chemotaxis protein
VLCLGLVNQDLIEPRLWLVTGLLAVSAGAAWVLLNRTFTGSATIFLVGLLTSIIVAALLYSTHQLLFALPLIVFIAALLIGHWLAYLTTIGACGLALTFASAAIGAQAASDVVAILLVIIASGGLAWIGYRPTREILNWAWSNYDQAQHTTDEVRKRQAELAQMSKSLVEACERLEQANLALAEARRAATEAHRLKDEFAVAISHELRTPLNLIIGYSEMLVHKPPIENDEAIPREVRTDIEAIYQNACHLSALVDDVLDLGRLDSRQLALQKQRSVLANIVGDAVSAVEGLYASAGLAVSVALPADLPPLHVDPTRIRQVVINLLTNAIRYTEEGGVRISARKDGGDIVVTVSDTGVGIPPEDLPYVFERFRQVGQLRRRGGFGLGLTISKHLVEMHAGTIWVESEQNVGTAFSFALPVVDNVAAVAANPKLQLMEVSHPTGEARRTLLVLDRDGEAPRIFQRYLDGYRILSASRPVDVSTVARNKSVHAAIITDPDVSPDDALIQATRRHLPRAPVLRCTLRTIGRAGRDLGVSAFLTKPVSREKLRDTLRDLKLRPRHVLVIDDDQGMVDLLGRMLRSIAPRCRVHTATSGEQGLALARELGRNAQLDLVLLDLLMPGLDGYAFLQDWKPDPALRDVSIIVVSAATEESRAMVVGDTLEIRRGGAIEVGDLMRAVRGVLDALVHETDSSLLD